MSLLDCVNVDHEATGEIAIEIEVELIIGVILATSIEIVPAVRTVKGSAIDLRPAFLI